MAALLTDSPHAGSAAHGASLVGRLPPPRNSEGAAPHKRVPLNITEKVNAIVKATAGHLPKMVPPYGERGDFIPEHPEDFGDGGAFPEIDIPQYPLGMGRPGRTATFGTGVVALTMDDKHGGRLQYEALARQGHAKDRVVYARPEDMRARSIKQDDHFPCPSAEEIEEITEKTRAAIEGIVQIRIASTKPKQVQASSGGDTYIRYVPRDSQDKAEQFVAGNDRSVVPGGNERIIRMVEAKVDPLEPAKFKHKKVAPLGGSPPAPVLHSPPRKATAEEQRAWYVPPSISNWKNPKGYTIPLDKRLASDGRGLQERVINEKFATLAESLYIAENYAREEISARNTLERKLLEKERREKEEQLRLLAEKARQARYVGGDREREREREREGEPLSAKAHGFEDDALDTETAYSRRTAATGATTSVHHRFDSLDERVKIRKERAMEREREYRMSRMGTERRQAHDHLTRERDISEKVALGLNVNVAGSTDPSAQFDLRLFHKGGAAAGLASGFHAGEDDTYNLYDKPLFHGSSAAQLLYHRPSKRDWDDLQNDEAQDEERDELQRETLGRVKAFADAQEKPSGSTGGPIQFERAQTDTLSSSTAAIDKDDLFGFGQFLEDAKRGKK